MFRHLDVGGGVQVSTHLTSPSSLIRFFSFLCFVRRRFYGRPFGYLVNSITWHPKRFTRTLKRNLRDD